MPLSLAVAQAINLDFSDAGPVAAIAAVIVAAIITVHRAVIKPTTEGNAAMSVAIKEAAILQNSTAQITERAAERSEHAAERAHQAAEMSNGTMEMQQAMLDRMLDQMNPKD